MPIARGPLLIAVAVATLVLTSASAASADSSRCTVDSSCAGRVTFQSYGEVFVVYDQVADSDNPVALYWLPNGSGPHLIWNTSGNGTAVLSGRTASTGDKRYHREGGRDDSTDHDFPASVSSRSASITSARRAGGT